MTWLNKIWLVIAGLLAAVGLSMLGRSGRQQKRAEDRETGYLLDGSAKALKKANSENKLAKKHAEAAKQAAAMTEKALEGIRDQDTADIISKWTRP